MQHKSNLEIIDRRRFDRRTLDLAVTFCRQGQYGGSNWHLGRIRDVGMGGIMVESGRSTLDLRLGCLITVLCLSDGGHSGSRQEPLVRIKGILIWHDAERGCFGLGYT